MPSTYVRVVGDGRVYQGACVVTGIIFTPNAASDYVDVYDGLDTTSGEKVMTLKTSVAVSWHYGLNGGVRFNHGIYVAERAAAAECTFFFHPLEL